MKILNTVGRYKRMLTVSQIYYIVKACFPYIVTHHHTNWMNKTYCQPALITNDCNV